MSSSIIFFFLFLLLFHSIPSSSSSTTPRTSTLFLPLKTQQLLLPPLPPRNSSINKLYFHRNVSLLVSLSLGSPSQNLTMVLDTGSELSWLLCSNTSNKNNINDSVATTFYPTLSSTYNTIPCSSPTCTNQTRDLPSPAFCDPSNPIRCQVSVCYADGSFSDGSLSSDLFQLNNKSPPFPVVFGCMTSTYASMQPESPPPSGLLGMNRGSLSLITQMGTRKFSYCISDTPDSSGVLLLGDSPIPLLLNYTPLVNMALPLPYFDRVAYSVQLIGIRVADTLLQIPKSILVPDHTGAGQTMVDSGTQFTFLLGPAYTILKNELMRRTQGILSMLDEPDFVYEGAFDLCYKVPLGIEKIGSLPAVTLMFVGAEVRVESERLLYRVEGEERGGDGIWCLTFGNSDLVPIEAYIIGHHHQQNLWVEYDLENGRVGFAPVKCDEASERLSALS